MPYIALSIPDCVPLQLQQFIRRGLEPFLRDVHKLLAYGDHTVPGDRQGLDHSTAVVLMSIVAGVSATLYAKYRKQSGKQFEGFLTDWFPWDLLPPLGGVDEHYAAKSIYDCFRNPFIHRLGLVERGDTPFKFSKGFGDDESITGLEGMAILPAIGIARSHAFIHTQKGDVLMLDCFYWVIRKFIYSMVAYPNQ